ncbi:small vasohibin-binding protein isoform X2 [Triplophysa dalaica]|uniref:small vasohibin-binding protein isoform X2 n=1 Tax=Triplophysa dalaica TaxID=1582913 RepID=UPI0024DF8065|nr:small vasohibin-binding protein isoform X2 [Triplophysa dalaica]
MNNLNQPILDCKMEPACRKDKQKQQTPTRGDRSKQKSAQQELKQRQRAEIYALNKVMTELEQQQFEAFCKQMQSQAEVFIPAHGH